MAWLGMLLTGMDGDADVWRDRQLYGLFGDAAVWFGWYAAVWLCWRGLR